MTTRSQISLALVLILCASPASATAEPYWIAYEGNDFPENEGWERTYGDGHWPPQDEPDRWLEDGALVIDTMRNPSLWEYYSIHRAIDPGPGELFIAEWRVRVDELGGWASYDPAVLIARDYPPGHALFAFDVDQFYAEEEDTWIPITPGQYHEYRFESTDMDSYDLFLDGVHVHSGWFDGDTFLSSYVAFGPGVQGGSSHSSWDFVRFGVVPEPLAIWLFAAGLVVCVRRTVRSSMRRLVLLPVLACLMTASATAEPFWIAYEGNDFPENEGWTRVYGDGQWPPQDEPDRWLEDGALVIDTMRNPSLWEYYEIDRSIDPDPGELFVAEWRVQVDEFIGHSIDPAVVIARDDPPGHAVFGFDVDQFYAAEEDVWIPVAQGQYHEYRFESSDMCCYDVFVDGIHIHSGTFDSDTFLSSFVNFGAGTQGASSHSRWDFVRFGVVPEPGAATLLAAGFLTQVTFRGRGAGNGGATHQTRRHKCDWQGTFRAR